MTSEAPPPDNGIPRGALIVVAVGLIACLAAAVLATGKGEGEAANLEWVQRGSVPDSKPVDVPGGKGSMQLVDGDIRATGTNVSAYSLFKVGATLRIDAGSPVGDARILCSAKGGPRSEIAQSAGGLRATYPRSSDSGIYSQEVPETLLIDFSARGAELAVLETEDFPPRFTSEQGVKLEWPEYRPGLERLKYFIAGGKPKRDLELPFYTVWKTTAVPSATLACTVTTSAGEATVKTVGALKKVSPPIDEEAEEEKEEQAEEEEEEAEGDEEEPEE
ncbi:MAG: hypothetical protein JJE35_02380 [Thermoleophilia bacterium]|nr:hypothetical protein [Thermoleophilia bacterium]